MAQTFPDGFLWGAATAAYQIEGAVRADGRGASIWDTFSHTPGRTLHGDTGDIAADHYRRWRADLDLIARLGLRGYRFSVAWPRVQPDGRGRANQAGLDFYRRLVDGLLERHVTPALTLYHWDLPQALQDRGGWTSREVVERFTEYVAIVADTLGDRVPLWITINEPWVVSMLGHAHGVHAPGVRDRAQALSAAHHLLLAHGRAARVLRAHGADRKVGITLDFPPVRPASERAADRDAARRVDGMRNRLFLEPVLCGAYPDDVLERLRPSTDLSFVRDGDLDEIAAPLDFLGVNYYTRQTVTADLDHPLATAPSEELGSATLHDPAAPRTATGWVIDPDGLTDLLLRLHRDYAAPPLYVTENGAAFADYVDPEGGVDDEERVDYLDRHFRAARRAVAEGVDLRGYFVWSLLDNFEWAEGYSKRFGLVWVDYPTQERRLKRSALWYREVIARNGPPAD